MEKKSGVNNNTRSLPGTGGSQAMGDQFQPNLAMGGGSYKIPFDLPLGPGGFSPKIELNYNTGYGNGLFGLGWALSLPFIHRKQASPYNGAEQFSLAGVDTLVPLDNDGGYIPQIQQVLQPFRYKNGYWTSVTPDLVEMQLGSATNSRIAAVVDGKEVISSWLIDKLIFPGNRVISYQYEEVGAQRYLKTISWSIFSLEFEYEDRSDHFSVYTSGFELSTGRRCKKISLHQSKLAPDTLMRTFDLNYQETACNKISLLVSFAVTGWRRLNGVMTSTAMPPFTFGYTQWDTSSKHIRKFSSLVTPPPVMQEDCTILDYKGTSLPGIMRMNGMEATYWENRGGLQWGPPERLRGLPQGVHLSDDNVRFADITGNGTADLVLASTGGGAYYSNDPEKGFVAKTSLPVAPGFDLNAGDTWLVDLDGDRVTDLLCFRNNTPMAFFNKNGEWQGPVVLPQGPLNALNARFPYVRFADMTGNGNPDLVSMTSRQIVYHPFLGNGKWGEAKPMLNTPEFDLHNSTTGVYLADVDGDGLSDLIITTGQEVRIYINGSGNFFSEPIVIGRTPRFDPQRFIVTDMTGSGAAGFLWTAETSSANPHEYWYLDLLNGVKPNLLTHIENGRGLQTDITYTTSVYERARDLAKGYRWAGYLPFPVHVIKNIVTRDTVTGDEQSTRYDYHEGNFDGIAREYMGFGMVESFKAATAHEETVWQKNYYHHRHQTAFDPAFIAGKGQPHRMEILNPVTGEVVQADETKWEARTIPLVDPLAKAYLCFESLRRSRRYHGTTQYAEETYTFDVDAIGNRVKEDRTGSWKDSANTTHTDVLNIAYEYASHPLHGLTSHQCQIRKTDGAGKLLKHITHYFDGNAFEGLPFGQVQLGFRSRQTEIALTETQHIAEAYNGSNATILPYYREETDPLFGKVYVHDTRRYRNDAFGNQLETLDAVGHRVKYTYDADNIQPVSYKHDDFAEMVLLFDPIAQQVAENEELNGYRMITGYDAMGNVISVFKPDAEAGKPTEEYEYDYSIPNSVVQKVRINPGDADFGWKKIKYFDGNGRIVQEKILTETGSYAVGRLEQYTVLGRKTGMLDAWISNTPAFETAPANLASQKIFYDYGGRIIQENLFNNTTLKYRYINNETWFFSARDVEALAIDPAHIPVRISRQDAWGNIVSLVERDSTGVYEEKREYDGLAQLVRVIDPMGHVALENIYDGWSNVIYTRSAEAGAIRQVFDAGNQLVLRTDADNRSIAYVRDNRSRITAIREDSPGGPLCEQFQYDAGTGDNLIGRLAAVTGSSWHVDYSYNASGKMTLARWKYNELSQPLEVRFGYNQQENVTSVTYPDGSIVNYDYYPTGLLQKIPGFIEAIEYGSTGKRVRTVFANGLETVHSYTPGDYLLSELITQNADHSVQYQHLKYTLDDIGQVLQIDDLANVTGKARNNQTFEYDVRNRLVRGTGRAAQGNYDFHYEYDALGNLVFSGESFAEPMDYGHHTGNALHPNRLIKRQSSALPEYEYDASGNMTADPDVGTLHYDKRHRVTRIDKKNGEVVEYDYDHNDRRIRTRLIAAGQTTIKYEIEGIWIQEGANITKIVVHEKKKLAVIPGTGDTLLHHPDRLGNVNVVSNLNTGAFVGHDEYTPYGQLCISIALEPNFSFQGIEFSEGLDMAMLGARFYRPRLGRFISPDLYLISKQDKIPGLLSAINMYCYVYNNPVNGADPSGNIAFLIVLLVAVIVGVIAGVIGAAVNGASTWDEWLLWVIGGAIGGALVAVTGGAAFGWIAMALGASFATAAAIGVGVWGTFALIGGLLTRALDESDSPVAWFFSFLIKWVQSPIMTTIGFLVAIGFAIAGQRWDFQRGMLFVEVPGQGGAITLGAIAWTTTSRWNANGVAPELASHEAVHGRTIASIGELGFYHTYLIIGAPWGAAQGGDLEFWSDVNESTGCGNPFEKLAHTYNASPPPSCNP